MNALRSALLLCCLWLPEGAALAKSFEIITGEWPPYVSAGMEGGGPVARIITEALAATGHSADFTSVPWKRAQITLEKGKAAASAPWSAAETFSACCLRSSPLLQQKMAIFYVKDAFPPDRFRSPGDLRDVNVACALGYPRVEEEMRKHGVRPTNTHTMEQAFQMLFAGRVDVVIENDIVGWRLIRKQYAHQAATLASSCGHLFSEPMYLMVSKDHPDGPELFDAFERGFAIIKKNGVLQGILAHCGLKEALP